ncbi:MAG: amidoligase family protein [Fodinibius sp.]|nr:amidoligase family protein [Fodinibius sp.]
MRYTLPPVPNNDKGDPRQVGLELEFAGIDIEKTAEIIQSLYGGQIEHEHRYHYEILGTEFGHFRVELDARILRKMASKNIFGKLGIDLNEDTIQKSIEDVVDKLAMAVVPLEIVMPPVPIEQLHRLEELRQKLQENKAMGTKSSLVHAFGMHINIESPNLEPATLRDYLRAFIVLYPWLMESLDIDISRRISPFVDPFPDSYARQILPPAYNPDRDQLIQDYLDENPTRNRPVDMMPIFRHAQPRAYPAGDGR